MITVRRRIQNSICLIAPKMHCNSGILDKMGAQRRSTLLAEGCYTLQVAVGEHISKAAFESYIPHQVVGSICLVATVRSTLLKEADKCIR